MSGQHMQGQALFQMLAELLPLGLAFLGWAVLCLLIVRRWFTGEWFL